MGREERVVNEKDDVDNTVRKFRRFGVEGSRGRYVMSADAKGISCGFFRSLAFSHAEAELCVAAVGKVACAQVGRNFNSIFYLTTK